MFWCVPAQFGGSGEAVKARGAAREAECGAACSLDAEGDNRDNEKPNVVLHTTHSRVQVGSRPHLRARAPPDRTLRACTGLPTLAASSANQVWEALWGHSVHTVGPTRPTPLPLPSATPSSVVLAAQSISHG